MKTNDYSRFFLLIVTGFILFHLSCKDDDAGTPIPPPIVSAGAVTGLVVADVGDEGNGTDLQVTFNPAADESRVAAYRILVVTNGQADNFDLSKAESISDSDYFSVTKTGSQITTTLAVSSTDVNGDLIVNDIAYKIFVLTMADGANATENTLSSPSAELTLMTEQMGASADAVMNILAEDVADNGDGSDLMVTFEKAADENTVSVYQLFVVESNLANDFDLGVANQNENSFEVSPSGSDISIAFPSDMKDSEGNIVVNNIPYVVFVLSVADGQNTDLNSLSAPSNMVTLTDAALAVEVTYICNDGVMISNGDKTVLIDGMIRWGNLSGWVRPPASELEAIENGEGIYGDIDVIMITHAHGDHYATPAVSNYLNDHPNTKLIATPQVLSGFSGFDAQIVDLSVQQFNKEKVTVNGIEIDVLFIKHFNQFGMNMCNIENYGYVVHMNNKKIMHLGDVDLSHSNLDQLDLLSENIDVAIIPTFGDLVSQENKDALFDNAAPQNIVATHFLLSQINTSMNQVNNIYPDAFIFDEPFEKIIF